VKRSPIDELLEAAEEAYAELRRVFEEHQEQSYRHEEAASHLGDVAQEIAETADQPEEGPHA
jgi:hypothetical protein